MKRIIKVKGLTGRLDVPSFLWTENETLTLTFDIEEKRVGRYVVVVLCGEQRKTVYLGRDMSVEITPQFIKDGGYQPLTILLEFRNTYGDKVIIPNDPTDGGFAIEPLRIERVNENNCVLAWMQKLEGDMAALGARLTTVENKLAAFEDEGVPLLAETEEIIEGE